MFSALLLSGVSFLITSALIVACQYLIRGRPEKAKKRLENYLARGEEQVVPKPSRERKTREKKIWKGLRKKDFLLITALSAFLTSFFFLFFTKNLLVSLFFGGLGSLIPTLAQRLQESKKSKLFNDQLSDTLTLISNSLKAGYSFLQAMDVVSREMPAPISQEFGRALKEANLGVPVEEALVQITKRIESEDLDLVLTAVIIQRQVGGNLAAILDNITETIRERVRIQGEIRTLTAQGKISGIVITCLPVALGLYLYLTSPKYINILFTHPLGLLMLGIAFFSQIIGGFLIYKIVNIKV